MTPGMLYQVLTFVPFQNPMELGESSSLSREYFSQTDERRSIYWSDRALENGGSHRFEGDGNG